MSLRFCVLGPLQVRDGTDVVPIRSSPQRRVLAMLLARAGEPVRVTELVDGLWPAAPPKHALGDARSYVSRLRDVLLEPDRIVHGPAGYTIRLSPDELDAQEFAHLVEQAHTVRESGDPAHAAELLRQALTLWRGEPYAGLEECPFLTPEIQGLNEQRLQALEDYAEISLTLGRHAGLVPLLTARLAEHPDRERMAGLLMRAQYASGQQTAALETYRRTRAFLTDEHGIEPGAGLRAIHEAVLRGEAGVEAPPMPAAPMQLPAAVNGFVGRADERNQLNALLEAARRQSTAVVISAVSGTAGVGKTALAVHWAHRIRDRFPDGQLYVNLRGFDQSGQVMAPADAIRGFLDALGVPPERIPVDLDAQAALYRSLLHGKRVLVVLDNARDSDQVRPLLPGSPGCLAVVTSRNQLTGLLVNEGAQPLNLDLLTPTEARELLARRIGKERVAAEPQAVDEIVELCVRLPLALAIVAARAASNPRFPLNVLAMELRDTRGSLDAFTGVRPVFSWSYQQLSPGAQRLFRLLGLHPGPDISAPAAASLLGGPPPLHELTRAHLVTEHTPGRYRFHDLLRAYAHELARTHDTETDRSSATHRLLDHYLHTAHIANRLLDPARDPLAPTPLQAGVAPERLASHKEAMAWFTAEHAALLAALNQAATAGFDSHAWRLAWTLHTFLDRRGHWHDQAAAWQVGLDAARRLGDGPAQARTHLSLADSFALLGRLGDAHTHLQHALNLYVGLGDCAGQAQTRLALAFVCGQQERDADALDNYKRALDLFRAAGHRAGQADSLNGIGWCYALLGMHQLALAYCEQAIGLFQGLGDRHGEAATWDSLGYAHHSLHQFEDAADSYQNALDLFRELGDRYPEADTLVRLGETQVAAGNSDTARQSWRQALVIFEALGHPDAEKVRAKLGGLDR